MKDSPTVGAYLDFAAEERLSSQQTQSDETFSSSGFNSVLRASLDREFRPLLILDVLPHSGLTETTRQIFLRNAFSSELFKLGTVSALLATGSGSIYRQEELRPALIEGLAEGLTVGEIAQKIRRLSGTGSHPLTYQSGSLEDVMANLGAALFTQDPTIRVVHPPIQKEYK